MATRSMLMISTLAMVSILVLLIVVVNKSCEATTMLSSRLVHRFSEELKTRRVSEIGEAWPERGSMEYYSKLLSSDLGKRRRNLGSQSQLLFPSEGSNTLSLGNDFGWLHYTWINIGLPSVSFLVALDSGSDLLWVPCNCKKCAPLSSSYYSSLDRDLNEYNISASKTSRQLPCSHQLCELGPTCKSSNQPCPYTVNYYSDNMETSGVLVEDILHLASGDDDASSTSVQVPVVIGCGRNQSGEYLDGVAPDGLMGLGPGDVSVPSFLATAGLVRNSFSLCFNDESSGRIFFGDQGSAGQHSTAFLTLDGKYSTYIVGVDAYCLGNYCYEHTNFTTLVDSGTSFTYFQREVYDKVVGEFDRLVNATRYSNDLIPWEYCYNSSSQVFLGIPSIKFMFASNNSFVVHNPMFKIHEEQDLITFCLAIQPVDGGDIGTIGQNFMTGYRMVFDRENLRLGWSHSNCSDLTNSKTMPLNSPPTGILTKPLSPNEQQNPLGGQAVGPALAGKPSAASARFLLPSFCLFLRALLLLYLLLMAL